MSYIILATCILSRLTGIIYNIFRHKNNINTIYYSTIWGSIFMVSLANIINKINNDLESLSYEIALCIEIIILYILINIKKKKQQSNK